MLQEGENEGYQGTVLMLKSVTTWSPGLVHTARMKLKEDVMFVLKEDTQDLAVTYRMFSKVRIWPMGKRDGSRQKNMQNAGNLS